MAKTEATKRPIIVPTMTYSGIIPNVAADKEAKYLNLSIMSFRSNPRTQVQIYELKWEAEIGPRPGPPQYVAYGASEWCVSIALSVRLGLQIFFGGLAALKSCQDVLALPHLGKCIPAKSHTHRPLLPPSSDLPVLLTTPFCQTTISTLEEVTTVPSRLMHLP